VTSPSLQQVRGTSYLLDLEQHALHRNIYRNSFRARDSASLNFAVNPLFELGQGKTVQIHHTHGGTEIMAAVEGVSVRDGVSINPLFDPEAMENEVEDLAIGSSGPRDDVQTLRPTKLGEESGYSSSVDSIPDPQAYFLRLLPPSKPQMVEQSFESLASLRHSNSLRDNRRKSGLSLKMGGSLRLKH